MAEIVKEMNTHGTAYLSRIGAKYLRAAKTSGGKVYVAIDSTPNGQNSANVSSMVNFVELARDGSPEMGRVLLAAYISCATSYSSSISEALDGDMLKALETVFGNLLVNKELVDRYKAEVESNAGWIRELNRRVANKPKD